MAIEWSSPGLDIHLDWTGGRGIADALRTAIREGRLAAGSRMPSTRALAADLGVARGTVTRAYAELAAEGYLRSRQGAPTTVAVLSRPMSITAVPSGPVAQQQCRWNLMPCRPDLSLFPRADWLAATRRALTGVSTGELGYCHQQGHPATREALASYLGRARGVVAAADQVVVCAGYTQGLRLLADVLRDRGATSIAFENPSLHLHHRVVEAVGLTPVGVPVDEDGIRVDLLAELLRGPRPPAAVVVTPAHHYPLGATLHPHRRAELVELARATGTVVIEDDYDGEFRFDRQPIGALQSMAPDVVAYAGTASKTLAPGLRLGWLVLPELLLRAVRAAPFPIDTGVIEQLTLAELLASGAYDRHVRRCRSHYRRRRDRVVATITALGGTLTSARIAAGLNVVVLVGDPAREAAVLARAVRRSVQVAPLGPNWLPADAGPRPGGIVVGYAAPPDHAFGPALQALCAALAE